LGDSPCQDGTDNDLNMLIDFDGGQSIHGAGGGGVCPPGVSDPDLDGVADADPHCGSARGFERAPGTCGLGFELVLVLLPLMVARRRRYAR
jgi:hypothetical protein